MEVTAKKVILKNTNEEYLIPYVNPSSTTELGTVKVDGKSITINDDGTIQANNGHELFDIVQKDHILSYAETEGYELLGNYVYKEAIAGSRYGYPDFYNKCLEEKNAGTATQITLGENTITMYVNANGHQFFDIADKDVVDAFYETTGSAWFYGVDTANERILLPRYDYVQLSTKDKVPVVGNGITLGITDGTDNYGIAGANSSSSVTVSEDYGITVGTKVTQAGSIGINALGVTTDLEKSGIEANLSRFESNRYYYMVVGNVKTTQGYSEVVAQGKEILEQVNEGIADKALDDLSNVVSSNTIVIDGQWIAKQAVVSTSVATTLTQYDLSDYLPNDGYNYEVMINAFAYKNSDAIVAIGSDIFANTDVSDVDSGFWQVRCSNYSRHSVNDFILPVGQGRYLTTIASASASPFQLNVVGYRRIGTNV